MSGQKDFAVFLDRDGTINVDIDFLTSPHQLQLIPRSAEAIRALNDLNIPVLVVTNQSGIARGLLTEEDLHAIHRRMDEMLNEHGASIDQYLYCPHHPDGIVEQYKKECECRKPNPGMLLDAEKRFGYNLKKSFVVGDKWRDVKTGKEVGSTTIQVSTGYGTEEKELATAVRDHFAADLFDAVQIITSIVKQ